MTYLREVTIGYTVVVNDQPADMCLVGSMADIVKEERGSLKGTRLCFGSHTTLFPTRKAANRAIERTKLAVASSPMARLGAWATAVYEVRPITTFVPKRFRQV